MRRLHLYGLLLIVSIGLAACDNASPVPTTELPTALPQPPTLPPTEPALATVAAVPTAETLPTDAPAPTAPLPTTAPTAETPTEPAPTELPPTELPTAEPTIAPPSESLMAPGQRDTSTLAEGEIRPYQYEGTQFQPAIFFVEPERDLDVELLAVVGVLTGPGLGEMTPLATADNALSGRPEIVVLSPESTGINTFVVRAVSGSGEYTAYLFNLTSPATGMAIQQSDTLAADEIKSYEVTSNGARPVIAMADPTNLSDIALDIFGPDGTLITTANFSGAGGAEVAYVLPMGTISYTVAVREINNMPSNFDVAVVTME